MISDLERDILQQLLHNEPLLAVLKTVFNKEVNNNFPKVNDIDSDSVLGQKYRAYIEAQDIIKKCFQELESHRVDRELKEDVNRAR